MTKKISHQFTPLQCHRITQAYNQKMKVLDRRLTRREERIIREHIAQQFQQEAKDQGMIISRQYAPIQNETMATFNWTKKHYR